MTYEEAQANAREQLLSLTPVFENYLVAVARMALLTALRPGAVTDDEIAGLTKARDAYTAAYVKSVVDPSDFAR
jgi:hypothetical protein